MPCCTSDHSPKIQIGYIQEIFHFVLMAFNLYRATRNHTSHLVSISCPTLQQWLGLLICILILVTAMRLYKFFYKVSLSNISFSAWYFILANIFEEPAFVPKKLESKQFFRLVLGTWVLTTVVLTNCYNGLMITELNSPLPATAPTSWRDLICGDKYIFKKYDKFKKLKVVNNTVGVFWESNFGEFRQYWDNSNYWYNDYWYPHIVSNKNSTSFINCFDLFSTVIEPNGNGILKYAFTEFLYAYGFNPSLNYDPPKVLSEESLLMYSFLNPRHLFEPKKVNCSFDQCNQTALTSIIEGELINCGRTVLAAKASDLSGEIHFLKKNYDWIPFEEGRDSLHSQIIGFLFKREGNSKVPAYCRQLVQSGIFSRLEDEYQRQKFSKRIPVVTTRVENKELPLNLAGKVFTVFVLCGITTGVGVIVFIFEIRTQLRFCCMAWFAQANFIVTEILIATTRIICTS